MLISNRCVVQLFGECVFVFVFACIFKGGSLGKMGGKWRSRADTFVNGNPRKVRTPPKNHFQFINKVCAVAVFERKQT